MPSEVSKFWIDSHEILYEHWNYVISKLSGFVKSLRSEGIEKGCFSFLIDTDKNKKFLQRFNLNFTCNIADFI